LFVSFSLDECLGFSRDEMQTLEAGLISGFHCVVFTKNVTSKKQRVMLGKKLAVKAFVHLLLVGLSSWKLLLNKKRADGSNTKLPVT